MKNSTAATLTTLTNPYCKGLVVGGGMGRQPQELVLLRRNAKMSQAVFVLMLLLPLQLESHPSRTTKHVIFGQTVYKPHTGAHLCMYLLYVYIYSSYAYVWVSLLSWHFTCAPLCILQLHSCCSCFVCFSLSRCSAETKSRSLLIPPTPPAAGLLPFGFFALHHRKLHFTAWQFIEFFFGCPCPYSPLPLARPTAHLPLRVVFGSGLWVWMDSPRFCLPLVCS